MPDTALIVVDMLNAYEHDDAEPLMESVREVLPTMADLVERAHHSDDVELVYVNDVYGHWNAGRAELVERVLASEARDLVEPIVPPEEAIFIVKARHSIFYQTPVEYMLRQMGVGKVILVGQVTEQCILYSALDAYIRHIEVAVPRDAVAHIHEDLAEAALRMMEINMRAQIVDGADCVR
ncbi:MAG TPA: isochorismatase family cysteine hydrolase [Solirubrobacteraceae bacterium]